MRRSLSPSRRAWRASTTTPPRSTSGLTSAIVDDIDLPDVGTKAGSRITWTTSDPAVVTAGGVITRPALGQGAATATLTARLTKGHEVATRSIAITVLAEFDDSQAVARDTADLVMVGLDDVRGNITLPVRGPVRFGDHLGGEHSDHHADRRSVPPGLRAPGRCAHAHRDDHQGLGLPRPSRSRPRSRRCRAAEIPSGTSWATSPARAWPTASNCDSGSPRATAPWTGSGLGGGRPSLVSQLGDQGLRDPFIIRSPDGDTFYMIATDLNWFNRNRDYLINDSQYIEVFESHDLVNWSPQRHVKVAPDNAGNAFAPEAYWDDSIGAYVVFWAQAMWQDTVNRTNPGNQQMWYTTTRDFRTFAPPAVWQDPYPQSRIDTTVIKVGDWYYRFTKNEAGNAGSDVFSEKHTQPARHEHQQLDAGRPIDRPEHVGGQPGLRGSGGVQGQPGRHRLPRAVLLLGRPVHQRRRLPAVLQPGHRGPGVGGQDAEVHQYRHRAARNGDAARAARVEPYPGHSESGRGHHHRPRHCPGRRSRRAMSSPPRCARRTATRPAAGCASRRPVGSRSPIWTTAWLRSPCRAPSFRESRRSGPSTSAMSS